MSPPTVPPALLGAWRREFIARVDGRRDDTTEAWWLQSPTWHVDLRVPPAAADRVHQTGWAGITRAGMTRAEWLPEFALPEAPLEPDVGDLEFESADILVERCPHGRYVERWHRAPGSAVATWGVRLEGAGRDASAAPRVMFVVVTGDLGAAALHVQGEPPRFELAERQAHGDWRVRLATESGREGMPWAMGRTGWPGAPWNATTAPVAAALEPPPGDEPSWRITASSRSGPDACDG